MSDPANPFDHRPLGRHAAGAAGEVLPPVEPPTASFILQLFLIPMVIVSIIVVVWLMIYWLAHMGGSPREIVRSLHKGDSQSWHQAGRLADLLRDPRREGLKYDAELAGDIAAELDTQIAAGKMDENQIKLRMYLCRALGEFKVLDGYPVLLKAATTERSPEELAVRQAALEAIAVLVDNLPSDAARFQQDDELQSLLRSAALRRGLDQPQQNVMMRERAAYVLGVVGGEDALDTLARMLDDPDANVRYNAANGLARHGDPRSIPMLLEMLDPANPYAVEGETEESGRDWKRVLVITNGIRAAEKFASVNQESDLGEIERGLESLSESNLDAIKRRSRAGIRVRATEALHVIQRQRQLQ